MSVISVRAVVRSGAGPPRQRLGFWLAVEFDLPMITVKEFLARNLRGCA